MRSSSALAERVRGMVGEQQTLKRGDGWSYAPIIRGDTV